MSLNDPLYTLFSIYQDKKDETYIKFEPADLFMIALLLAINLIIAILRTK
jgi:hypothetical protein